MAINSPTSIEENVTPSTEELKIKTPPGEIKKLTELKSIFQEDAIVTDKKYWCPKCGSPVFASKVAVWCSKSWLEDGDCQYSLMSG